MTGEYRRSFENTLLSIGLNLLGTELGEDTVPSTRETDGDRDLILLAMVAAAAVEAPARLCQSALFAAQIVFLGLTSCSWCFRTQVQAMVGSGNNVGSVVGAAWWPVARADFILSPPNRLMQSDRLRVQIRTSATRHVWALLRMRTERAEGALTKKMVNWQKMRSFEYLTKTGMCNVDLVQVLQAYLPQYRTQQLLQPLPEGVSHQKVVLEAIEEYLAMWMTKFYPEVWPYSYRSILWTVSYR
uniref:Uncharacterized protein n=1 Tax=Macrostomum lignano TaxID=282301 RepID=A0A1I8F7G3_9PLAT